MSHDRGDPEIFDVCIVGAGPAGLSAALLLGRCRRRVVLFDSGKPRNAMSRGLHGYLTRDGISPVQLRKLGRDELMAYPSVSVRDETVSAAKRREGEFAVETRQGARVRARMLLLATGREDLVPARPGFHQLYGRGVYHCPFCDGWEHRDEPLVAYGRGPETLEVALELLTWSADVTMCTDGPCELVETQRDKLAANHIHLIETTLQELHAGTDGTLDRIRFVDHTTISCRALFFVSPCPQRSSLPENLGCEFDDSGAVKCNGAAAANVPGLFVAGNVRCGLHLAITAAAEGVEAAVAINDALLALDVR